MCIRDSVDAAAGEDGAADGLLGVLDGEVAFLNHLGNGLKSEVGGDQQSHADDPAGDAVNGVKSGVEDIAEVGQVPVAAEQQDEAGQDGDGDVAEQHHNTDSIYGYHIEGCCFSCGSFYN